MRHRYQLFFHAAPLLFLPFFFASCAGTVTVGELTVPKSVDGFLLVNGWDFSNFHPSILEPNVQPRFFVRYYLYQDSPDEILQLYVDTPPRSVWCGPIARFGLMHDTVSGRDFDKESPVDFRFDEGQIYMIDLYIESLMHIASTFQITDIDSETRSVVFRYLNRNNAKGYQKMDFLPCTGDNGETWTLVRHSSEIASDSPIRDAVFYEGYHNEAIDEFHRSVSRFNDMRYRLLSPRRAEALLH